MKKDTGKRRCIVIGAGELTVSHIPYKTEDFVIAVDAGFQICRQMGITPDICIGDFDSLPADLSDDIKRMAEMQPESVITLTPEKDDTDMLAALKVAAAQGFTEISIYAAAGGRLDHTLANLQCLLYLKRQGINGVIVHEDSRILVLENETLVLPPKMKGTVSIFAMGDHAAGVTLEGLKYPLKEYTITNDFPIGVSNEFRGEEAKITVREGVLAVMIWESVKK